MGRLSGKREQGQGFHNGLIVLKRIIRVEVPVVKIYGIVDSLSLVIIPRCWQEAILIAGEAGCFVTVLTTSEHKAERDQEETTRSTTHLIHLGTPGPCRRAALVSAVSGNWIRKIAPNIATELSLHSPPWPQIMSFGTRTIQQGTRAFPV